MLYNNPKINNLKALINQQKRELLNTFIENFFERNELRDGLEEEVRTTMRNWLNNTATRVLDDELIAISNLESLLTELDGDLRLAVGNPTTSTNKLEERLLEQEKAINDYYNKISALEIEKTLLTTQKSDEKFKLNREKQALDEKVKKLEREKQFLSDRVKEWEMREEKRKNENLKGMEWREEIEWLEKEKSELDRYNLELKNNLDKTQFDLNEATKKLKEAQKYQEDFEKVVTEYEEKLRDWNAKKKIYLPI